MSASLLVVTPSWRLDPALAAAAARAGGVGLLDLGVMVPAAGRAPAVERLAVQAGQHGGWGVRWDALGRTDRGLPDLGEHLLPWLVLAGLAAQTLQHPGALRRQIDEARAGARRVIVEVGDADAARAAAAAGCDGVLLRTQESGGPAGSETALILLQKLADGLSVPYWVQGAFGPDTAAAAILVGAAGVVLAEEVWLAREAPFDPEERDALARHDGSGTVVVEHAGRCERLLVPGGPEALHELETRLGNDMDWPEGVYGEARHRFDGTHAVPLGQGIALAPGLARRGGTVAGILDAFRMTMRRNAVLAADQRALGSEGPLARDNGTRYPILQGPMTRVSDVAAFCDAVEAGGGLPFLALALMRGPEVDELLTETTERLGDRPWGVGVLGFVPPELRAEQLASVHKHRPRFAVIAGGRPSQARALEEQGVATYLHVPSPRLLRAFLEQGARRFIFEGRECGGHVGPRSSLALWQSIVDELLAADLKKPEEIHAVFAGGIHDGLSAAMVATLSARLSAQGMRTGVLMGTAYLFTEEAVRCGAITPVYQAQAVECHETALLTSGLGHATRCARTPFADEFDAKRRELLSARKAPEEVRLELEMLNVGRLRVASKGLERRSEPGASRDAARRRLATEGVETASGGGTNGSGIGGSEPPATRRDVDRRAQLERGAALLRGKLEQVDAQTQRQRGMYMIGDVATLRHEITTVAALHEAVSAGAAAELSKRTTASAGQRIVAADETAVPPGREPVAIVGMACRFPGSPDLASYWRHIVESYDAVREVPAERWPADLYFNRDRLDRDGIYSKWGAFLEASRFDPLRYGIPPASVAHVDPLQLLMLDVCREALDNAGYDQRPFPRERTAAIFASGGVGDMGISYAVRTVLPEFLQGLDEVPAETRDRIVAALRERLPGWSEDSFPGILVNVLSGRVANRLDLKGSNFVVDAACAASLAALQTALEQLRAGSCDMALVGAADGTNNAFTFMSFARTHALTPSGRLRAFDDAADGIVLGEGVAAVVLKRLADAERDGDRIWAVVRGIGSSSDGRNRSLTAPYTGSQALAIQRGWEDAGLPPASVGMVEAHATGTAVGDRSEIAAMRQVFGERGEDGPTCAVGSVKSMIGHTKTVAGMAGLIKTTLALAHRTLPPTLNVETPNRAADLPSTPFYVNTEPRPWVHLDPETPRRAGVSAFGFGGTNFHAVLEEYNDDTAPAAREDLAGRPVEPFLWVRSDRAGLAGDLATMAARLDEVPSVPLEELAASHARDEGRRRPAVDGVRLAVVAASVDDLRQKLARAGETLADDGESELTDLSGLFWSTAPSVDPATVCFLYPGQGSQRVGMLRDLMLSGPLGTTLLEEADRELAELLPAPLAGTIYPPPSFTREESKARQAALDDTRMAQPALGVMNLFATELLARFGLTPACTAGHSYGEYVALCAAGLNDPEHLLRISALRGQAVHEAGRDNPGGMLAVAADEETTRAAIEELGLEVEPANFNAPRQTIVAGTLPAIDIASRQLPGRGLAVRRIAVTAPFHTSAMEGPSRAIATHLREVPMTVPRLPVYSNVTAEPYAADLDVVREQLALHLARPVRFVELVRALHRDGARLFVEAGPGRILTGLVGRILADRPHHAVALDMPGQPGWTALARLLAQVHAVGLPVDLGVWFEGRPRAGTGVEATLGRAGRIAAVRPTDWLLSPAGARPALEGPPSAPSRRSATSIMGAAAPDAAGGKATVSDDPAGSPPPDSIRALEVLQETMERWLELQQQQQRLSERFLALQERVVAGILGQPVPVPVADVEPSASTLPAGEPLGVAPAPVLPDLPGNAAPRSAPAGATFEVPPAPTPTRPVTAGKKTATEPAATDAPAVDGASDIDTFRRDLIGEVSARTGYPEDMLDLDVPLEAGLGIDSIKTMEIFSALKPYHAVLADEGQDEEEILVQFTQMKTLRDILDHYASRLEQIGSGTAKMATAAPGVTGPGSAGRETPVDVAAGEGDENPRAAAAKTGDPSPASDPLADGEHARVERLVLRSVPAPTTAGESVAGTGLSFPRDDVLLVLGDAPEMASALEAALSATGIRAVHVVPGTKTARLGAARFEVDLSDAGDVQRLSDEILSTAGGRVGGLVNLLTLSETMRKPGLNGMQAPLRLVRWLTNVARVFEDDIRASSARGGGWLLNVTTLDGRFGLRGRGDLPIAQAGSLGFFKSLAREWRGARVKNVDLDPQADPQALVVGLMQELSVWDETLEVGIDGEGRWRLELQDAPLPGNGRTASEAAAGLDLGPDGVVLATGGARGITAEVIKDLARRTRARLIIVGRSPEPAEEPPDLRALTDTSSLRAALLEQMRAEDPSVTPAKVEERVGTVLRDRTIRGSLAACRASGSAVEYRDVDVRDTEAFGALLDGIYARYGRIDGVIHGAGRIEDRWLKDKTLESLARVFETKVNGALVLARKLRPEGLRFLVFFSSVSGRFGNAGQTDYSAANECLNKLAAHLDRVWPARVVSLNWGPWDAGMLSEGLRAAYRRRGIELIPVETGVRSFMDEIGRHEMHRPEVILACTPHRIAAAAEPGA